MAATFQFTPMPIPIASGMTVSGPNNQHRMP